MIIKIFKKAIIIIKILYDNNFFYKYCNSQNNDKESKYLYKLANYVDNKFFVEIGFHNLEFNSYRLIKKNYSGLMIDGGRYLNILIMKFLIFVLRKKIKVSNIYLTKKNISKVFKQKKIGVLSIDIDGNDYWILKEILKNKIIPELIILEYNQSFKKLSLSVPYKDHFNRFNFSTSGFYHGASIKAFNNLLTKNKYSLVKSIGGLNAVFVNQRLKRKAKLKNISINKCLNQKSIRSIRSKLNLNSQYNLIKNLKFFKV